MQHNTLGYYMQNWDGYNVYMRAAKPGFKIGSKVTAPKKGGRRLQLAAQLEAGAARHMQAAARTLASASSSEVCVFGVSVSM